MAITLLAGANLILPLDRDQSFFLYVAKHIQSGSILYKDIWDVKQPGVFLFYMVAGELFGYDERGVHLLELFWQAAQCGAVTWWASKIGIANRYCCLAPLFTTGAYYCAAWTWHMTQVEALVGLPLLLAGGLALPSDAHPKLRFLAAGVAGGVVLVFKTMLFPVLLAMWTVAFVCCVKNKEASSSVRSVVELIAMLGIGSAIPVIAVVAWASQSGFLTELIFATFIFPLKFAASESHYHFYPTFRIAKTLFQGLGWFMIQFGPLLVLAALGVRELLKRRKAYAYVLVAWLITGAAVFAAQTWWAYQLLLLLPPLGLLAAAGTEWLVTVPKIQPVMKFGVISSAAIFFAVPAYAKYRLLISHGTIPAGKNRIAYQKDVFQKWSRIVDDSSFLRSPDAAPGPIYVREGSLYWLASGRELVYPSDHGYQLPWQRLAWPAAVMRAAPVYMRLPKEDRESINSIDPTFQQFLDKYYIRIEGKPPWYARVNAEHH